MSGRTLPEGDPSDQTILDFLERFARRELSMRHRVLSGAERDKGVREAECALRGIEILRRRHVETAVQERLL